MDMFDFAGLLFGGSRTATDATTVTATGAGASDGGEVGITLDADVTPAEDTGVEGDADQTIIDLPTSPDVDEGDEVIVTLVGEGPLKTPVVTANPGSGDRMRALVNAAQTVADAAQAVAEAVNQHFFADTSGIHVTEATQEEWDESHSGANVLINSIGQLFRDGLNNLLTLTTENGARALTIWDGLGNSASNILARFSSDGISFADGTSFDIGDSSSYIHFDGNGHINIGGSGLTIGGYATNADVADAIDGISVGGRNLVWDTAWNDVANRWTAWGSPTTREIVEMDGKRWLHLVTTTTKFQGYQQRPDKRAGYGEIQAGDTLTISFTAYATVATSDNISCIGVHWLKSDGSIYGQTWITTELTTVPKRFVKTVSIVDGAPVVGFNIMVGDNSAVARELWISEVKLEKGNIATDWSPAPEDVDSAISDAAKTATSYVTDITGGGIMVHPSGDQTTGVQITDDVDILRDGTSVINIGTDDAVRVGSASGGHIAIDSDSMGFWASAAQLAMRFTGQKVDYPSGISTYFAQIEDGVTRENEVYNDNGYISLYTREEPTYEGSDEKVVTESMATMHAYARGAEGTAEISVFMHQDPDANTASRGAIIASDTLTCEGTTNVGDPYGSVDGLTIGSPTRVTSSESCTALTNDTMGPYVALTAGKWLIMGNWGFTNTSSSAKRLTIGLYRNATGSAYTWRVHTTASSSTAHKLEVVDTIVLTSDEVITLYASSSPASTSASTQWITAVRLS